MNARILYFIITILAIALSSCSSNEPEIVTEHEEVTSSNIEKYQFQEGEHIHWSSSYENGEIRIQVELAEGWKTYSQYNENFMGPLPTLIVFSPSDDYELIGSVEESMVKMTFDKEADQDLSYFSETGIFTQKIKLISGEKFVLKGFVNYMTCNDNGCEPPIDYLFELEITP